jgi:glutamate dehydrogenase
MIKRHFRELGPDIQNSDFTAVGVGDMSGDVFGNGMLQSRHTRLLAAFNHLHIFIDPNPDPPQALPSGSVVRARSSWADYDRTILWRRGAFDARQRFRSPGDEAVFDIAEDHLTPAELIKNC